MSYTADKVLVYDIKADIYLASKSETIHLTSSEISDYTIDAAVESGCIPVGSTNSNSFSMSFATTKKYSAKELDNARVVVQLAVNGGEFKPFGVWFIDDVTSSEQDPFTEIDGSDALNTCFEDVYAGGTATTHLGLVQLAVAAAAVKAQGLTLKTTDFHNYNVSVPATVSWGDDTTLRDVVGYVAACAGGFARINWSGELEILTCGKTTQHVFGADYYTEFSSTGGTGFDFNCLQYMFAISEDDLQAAEYARFPIDSTIEDNACNTIQINSSPLITTQAMCADIRDTLKDSEFDGATVSCFGNTDFLAGDEAIVTDLSGTEHRLLISSLSLTFDAGGLMADITSDMPSITAETSSYSSGVSVFNADGTIRYEAIDGANQKVIAATAAYFQNLSADTVTAKKLLATLIEATNIRAEQISAQSTETDNLTAAFAAIVQASIRKLNAGTITTDSLITSLATIAVAQITTANIQKANIDWAEIATLSADVARIANAQIEGATIKTAQIENFQSTVAKIIQLTAKTGDFDLATITNLLSSALILKQGIADSMMITNLSVTSANMLNATVDKLVLHGSDDKYYHVFVGTDGTITTEEVTVTEEEIAKGETADGRQITATTANVAELNSQTVKATQAILDTIFTESLTAGKITANEALIASATIPVLYTSALTAIGDTLDISANKSITALLDSTETISNVADTAKANAENALQEITETKQTVAEVQNATATLQTQLELTNSGLSLVQTTTTDLEGRVQTIESGVHISGSEIGIYSSDSPYRNTITNDGWKITENGSPVITCAETKLTAPRVQVTDALIIGDLAWKPSSDKHLRLLKYGR